MLALLSRLGLNSHGSFPFGSADSICTTTLTALYLGESVPSRRAISALLRSGRRAVPGFSSLATSELFAGSTAQKSWAVAACVMSDGPRSHCPPLRAGTMVIPSAVSALVDWRDQSAPTDCT